MKHARLPRVAMESERYASVYSFLHKTPLDDCEAEPPAISVSALGGERDPMNRSAAPLPPTPQPLALLLPPSPRHTLPLSLLNSTQNARSLGLRPNSTAERRNAWRCPQIASRCD